MLTREQILQSFTDNFKKFQQYAKNIAGEDHDDLFGLCTLQLLEFPEERLQTYWNEKEGLKPFFIKMLQLQYNSKTSYYHTTYRKTNRFIQERGADILYNNDSVDILAPEVDRMAINQITDKLNIAKAYISKSKQITMFTQSVDLEVWEIYVEQGSLRKTVAALPAHLAAKLDLKKVHEIIRDMQRTFRKHLNAA